MKGKESFVLKSRLRPPLSTLHLTRVVRSNFHTIRSRAKGKVSFVTCKASLVSSLPKGSSSSWYRKASLVSNMPKGCILRSAKLPSFPTCLKVAFFEVPQCFPRFQHAKRHAFFLVRKASPRLTIHQKARLVWTEFRKASCRFTIHQLAWILLGSQCFPCFQLAKRLRTSKAAKHVTISTMHFPRFVKNTFSHRPHMSSTQQDMQSTSCFPQCTLHDGL